MLTTVEEVYRNGQIALVELPDKAIRQRNKAVHVNAGRKWGLSDEKEKPDGVMC